MGEAIQTITTADLSQNADGIVGELRGKQLPVVVLQDHEETAVLVSIEAYRRMQEEREILLSLLEGERDIAHGAGYTLEEVLGEVDAMLARDS